MTSGHLLLDRQTYKIVFVEINVSAKSYGPNACELFLSARKTNMRRDGSGPLLPTALLTMLMLLLEEVCLLIWLNKIVIHTLPPKVNHPS